MFGSPAELSQGSSQLVPVEVSFFWALFGSVGCPRFITGQQGLVYAFKKLEAKKKKDLFN